MARDSAHAGPLGAVPPDPPGTGLYLNFDESGVVADLLHVSLDATVTAALRLRQVVDLGSRLKRQPRGPAMAGLAGLLTTLPDVIAVVSVARVERSYWFSTLRAFKVFA
ncbi:MAG: hypothetical protein OXI81_21785 [Paracoccaceae bacterium]|nr:hypothetical protein [Paracoccaceae bacterium]